MATGTLTVESCSDDRIADPNRLIGHLLDIKTRLNANSQAVLNTCKLFIMR